MNTYYYKVQGNLANHSREKISNTLKNVVDSLIDISVGFNNSYLITVTFQGTREKCAEELSGLFYNGKRLEVNIIEPYPIFKTILNAPMLYEDENCPYPYFPKLQCDLENSISSNNTENANNSDKYSRYNKNINLSSKDVIDPNNNFRMPPASEPPVSPWNK